MLTADVLITRCLEKLKENTDGTGAWTRAKILQLMNLHQDKITTLIPNLIRKEDTSLTTANGTRSYTIPSTMGKILYVLVGTNQLRQTTEDAVNNDAMRGIIDEDWRNTTGTPTHYFYSGNTLYLYPTPEDAETITIVGELLLTQLTDSASVYALENINTLRKAQLLLIYPVVAELAEDDGNFALSDRWQAKFEQELHNLMVDEIVLKTVDPQSLLIEKGNEDCE